MASSNVTAMRRRLTALLRKAKIKEAAAANLLDVLLENISTKRDYENVFGEEGTGVEEFSRVHSLGAEDERILFEMQRVKDIFTPNPVLDTILTIVFIMLVSVVGWAMYQQGHGLSFAALLLVIDAVVHRVKDLSARAGRAMSRVLLARGFVEEDPLAGKIQVKKWQEQSWQLFVHVGFTVIETIILTTEGRVWWDEPRTSWLPHPRDQYALHSPLFVFFYMAQLAVWIYTCFIHRFVDERRKDYFVMYLHHVVTIALVAVSWAHGYWRIGLIVVYIHDVSDIFVDTLKMVNYLKLEGPKGWFGSEVAYASCLVAWIYWRLYEYPFRVLKGAYFDTWTMLSSHPEIYPGCPGVPTLYGQYPLRSPPEMPMYFEMNTLLWVLLLLHVYWFHLFVMIGYRILTESAREASRQEYEGDSDEGGDKPNLEDAVPDAPQAGGAKARRTEGGSLEETKQGEALAPAKNVTQAAGATGKVRNGTAGMDKAGPAAEAAVGSGSNGSTGEESHANGKVAANGVRKRGAAAANAAAPSGESNSSSSSGNGGRRSTRR